MKFAWNILNHTGEALDVATAKMRPKIERLERLLDRFPAEAVHLQVVLDQNVHKKTYRVGLNLRVPSNILHAEKENKSLVRAVDGSVSALVRQLKKVKATYRHEAQWARSAERDKQAVQPGFHEEPAPMGSGPQSVQDLIAGVLTQEYDRLLHFVSRQLEQLMDGSVLPAGEIEASDIVDRVAEIALRTPYEKPDGMDYDRWFVMLAFRETQRMVERMGEGEVGPRFVEAEIPLVPPPVEEDDQDDLEQRMLEATDEEPVAPEWMEYQYAPVAPHEEPDVQEFEAEMLASLRRLVRLGPKQERDIFEMYFLEGLDAEDIAIALDSEVHMVRNTLEKVQAKLRNRLVTIKSFSDRRLVADDERMAFEKRVQELTIAP